MRFDEVKEGHLIIRHDDDIGFVYKKDGGIFILSSQEEYGGDGMKILFYTKDEVEDDDYDIKPYKPSNKREDRAVKHQFIIDVFNRRIYFE